MNKWISVEDRLPELYKEILFFHKISKQIYLGCFFNNNVFWTSTEDDCLYSDGNKAWQAPVKDVSHWMELPEPPKENDE